MPNNKSPGTVSLPILSDDRVYVSVQRTITETIGSDFGEADVNPAELSDYIRDGMFGYGWRQLLNDAAAGPEKGKADIAKRRAALLSGAYAFGSGGGAPKSPFAEEMVILLIGPLTRMKGGKTKAKKFLADTGTDEAIKAIVLVALRKAGKDIDDPTVVNPAIVAYKAKMVAKATERAADRIDVEVDVDVSDMVAKKAA